jgi:hypothetical protein
VAKIPTFAFKGTTVATTYRFQVPEPLGGWALCTINDATGELSVHSDWGNWSYRWWPSPANLGNPTLTHFIADRDAGHCDYLADKLFGGRRASEEFDVDATIAAMRRTLAERRREEAGAWVEYYRDDPPEESPDVLGGEPPRWANKRPYRGDHYGGGGWWYEDKGEPLTKGIAREIWKALGSLAECRDSELFCERFFKVPGHVWITDEPWEHLVYSAAFDYQVLCRGILPALVEACAAEVKRRAELERAPACTGHLAHDEFTACPAHDARELR